jgi:hypothetical protein
VNEAGDGLQRQFVNSPLRGFIEHSAMVLNVLRFASVFLTSIGMAGGLAHAFELRAKIRLSQEEYTNSEVRGGVAIEVIGTVYTARFSRNACSERCEVTRWFSAGRP